MPLGEEIAVEPVSTSCASSDEPQPATTMAQISRGNRRIGRFMFLSFRRGTARGPSAPDKRLGLILNTSEPCNVAMRAQALPKFAYIKTG